MKKLLVVLLALAACKAKSKKSHDAGPTSVDTVPTAKAPAGIRLADDVTPLAYRVSLEVDPTRETFAGTAEIDVELAKPAAAIWIHVGDLTITDAQAVRGADSQPLTQTKGEHERVALIAAGEHPAGPATLKFTFTGLQDPDRPYGLRRRVDRGDWYIVTQHEAEGARRAFPCFDEPRWKVPFTLTLTVPAGNLAIGNAPVESEETAPDGRRVVRFAATPPIPTYLVALAVGPFDAVDAGKSRTGQPIRIIVPKGRAADAAFAAAELPKIQAALEDYTGSPYPYAKLDHVVIPSQPRGAMENPGLITYPPKYLLVEPNDGAAVKAQVVAIGVHEIAHQWFGNLVTMAWWDDVWLNEAFATWATSKLVEKMYPELGGASVVGGHRRTALDADGKGSARRIRQPVHTTDEIGAAFDGITYQKGATVLRMFERYVGEDAFQRGVRAYLSKHAWKHATGADFLAALDEASDQDVSAAFSTFLDQAGAPVIEMEVDCPEGGAAKLLLHQRRHLLLGASTPPGAAPRWQVPVCVRTSEDAAPRCTLLTEPDGELDLGSRCPSWVAPNAGGLGYYRAALARPHDRALFTAPLAPAELAAAYVDLSLAVDAGEVGLDVLIDQLPAMAKSDDRVIRDLAVTRLDTLLPMVEAADRAAFTRLAVQVLAPIAPKQPWKPQPGDSLAVDGTRGRVATLLAVLGDHGDDAVRTAKAWLDDHTTIPVTLWPEVLAAAVRAKPDEMFDALLARATKDQEPDTLARRAILTALGQVEDPARLGKALELVIADQPVPFERLAVLGGARTPDTQAAVLDFLKQHEATLLAELAPDWHGRLVYAPCIKDRRDEVVSWLATLAKRPEIGQRAVDQAVEGMNQCVAIRGSLGPQLAKSLQNP